MERDVEKEHEKGQSQYGRRISDPKEIQERCAHVYEEGRKKKTLFVQAGIGQRFQCTAQN